MTELNAYQKAILDLSKYRYCLEFHSIEGSYSLQVYVIIGRPDRDETRDVFNDENSDFLALMSDFYTAEKAFLAELEQEEIEANEEEDEHFCSHCNGTGMPQSGPPDVGSCSFCNGRGC